MSEPPEYEDCPRCDGKRAFEKGKGYTHCVWCEVIDLQKELEQVKGEALKQKDWADRFQKEKDEMFELWEKDRKELEQVKGENEELKFLKSIARYQSPSWGFHNGGFNIHIRVNGQGDCPRDIDAAIKLMIKEKAR